MSPESIMYMCIAVPLMVVYGLCCYFIGRLEPSVREHRLRKRIWELESEREDLIMMREEDM